MERLNLIFLDKHVIGDIMLARFGTLAAKRASSDMKQYIKSRTSAYVMLCLIGGIVLLIAFLTEQHEFDSWFLTLAGVVIMATGIVYLIDKVFFYEDRMIESLPWKTGKIIFDLLKVTLFEVAVILIALIYVVIVLKIAVGLSLEKPF